MNKKVLSLSLSNGLEAIVYGNDERLETVLGVIGEANAQGNANEMVEVDSFRGSPGFVNALSVIGYNITDHVGL